MIKLPKIPEHLELKDEVMLFLLASVLFWTPVIIFSKIAGEILENEPILLDEKILLWIHAHSNGFLDHFFFIITTIGGVELLGPISLIIVGLFWYKKQRLNALIILTSVVGSAIANTILKLLFHRERPTFWMSVIHETSYSFPSGHAMSSASLVLSLILIAWSTRARWWAIVGGGIFAVLVGISRLYFGVHYPTDIVAGWCVSFLWVVFVFTIAHELSKRLHENKKTA